MKKIVLAAAALASVSAFAQSSVSSSTGVTVTSGTGVVVTPGAPSATVTVTPAVSGVATAPAHRMLPGGTMVQHHQTTVLGGPSGSVAGTKTDVTTYWANVPADAGRDASFQRWQRLK